MRHATRNTSPVKILEPAPTLASSVGIAQQVEPSTEPTPVNRLKESRPAGLGSLASAAAEAFVRMAVSERVSLPATDESRVYGATDRLPP